MLYPFSISDPHRVISQTPLYLKYIRKSKQDSLKTAEIVAMEFYNRERSSLQPLSV